MNQNYSYLELILIDDGSIDGSKSIAESFHDDRIVSVSNKQNHGLAWCRNQGLALAKGEYIGFVDADDIAKSEKLEKLVGYLEEHKEVLVVSSGYTFIDKYGRHLPKKVDVICDDLDIRANMLFGNCIAGPCALFRRKIVDRYHIEHDVRMRTSQDYFFWIKCLAYGQFHNLDIPLFYYRVGHNSRCDQSQASRPRQYENILKKIFRYAWKIRGFCLRSDEVEFIYKYFYKNEKIDTLETWIKGYRLYCKIHNQANKLKLLEKQKVLELYRKHMKRHIIVSIRFITDFLKIKILER